MIKYSVRGTLLNNTTIPQDNAALRELAYDSQVVANEHVGDPGGLADVCQKIEDLRLNRDVQGGNRLIQNEDFGLHSQRASDRDALTLTAREAPRYCASLSLIKSNHVG